ncbi:MAG TPA: hypothetical protein V6D28_31620 [Leptolyngbyaceae cyanobacterium]
MKTLVSMPLTKSPAGTWTIATAKTADEKPYFGTVQIHPMGQIYTVSWLTTLGDYTGLAFYEDGYIFAGCAFHNSYGVTLYTINDDGTLDGKWTSPSYKGAIGTEKLVGGIPGQLEGTYHATSSSPPPNSANYEGTLNIQQLNDIYQVSWSVGIDYQGTGLRVGNKLVVAWGEGNVFCMNYQIENNAALGRWAYLGNSALAMENLHKIC